MDYTHGFAAIEVVDLAKGLASKDDRFFGNSPFSEQFGLVSQIRRASISILANIAKGSSGLMPKDNLKFLPFAFCTLTEFICQIIVANNSCHLKGEGYESLRSNAEELTNKLNSLYTYRNKKLKSKSTKYVESSY